MLNFALFYAFFIILRILPFCILSYVVFKNDLRFSSKVCRSGILYCWIASFLILFIVIYKNPYDYALMNRLLLLSCATCIAIWLVFFKGVFFKKLYSFFLLSNMGIFQYGCINYIHSTLFGYDNCYYNSITNFYITILAYLILFPLLSYMYLKSFNEDIPNVYSVAWIFPFFSFIVLIRNNKALIFDATYTNDHFISYLLLFVALVSFNFLIQQITNICLENEKLRTSEVYNKLTLANYNNIQDRIALVSKEKHESRHRLILIKALCKEKDYIQLENYVDTLINNSAFSEPIIYTKNPIVNSILCDRISIAKHHNIDVTYDINVPESIQIYIDDLCSLLMNILDNSIEACKKMNSGAQPYIKFKMLVEDNFLFISCTNNKINDIKIRNNKLITSKKDKSKHGIGSTVIDNIVNKYNGFKNIDYTNNKFTIKAYLKLNDYKEMA